MKAALWFSPTSGDEERWCLGLSHCHRRQSPLSSCCSAASPSYSSAPDMHLLYIYTFAALSPLHTPDHLHKHTHARTGGRERFIYCTLTNYFNRNTSTPAHSRNYPNQPITTLRFIHWNLRLQWAPKPGRWRLGKHHLFFFPIFNCQGVMFTSHSFVSSIPGTGTKEFLHIKTTWSHQLQGTIVAQNVYRWDAPVCVCVCVNIITAGVKPTTAGNK